MKTEDDEVCNEARQELSENGEEEKEWRDGDLMFCETLHRSAEKKLTFEFAAEELRSLAFQYLYRHYRLQAICLSASAGTRERVEEAFAWCRFTEITDVLCPGRLTDDFRRFIAEADAEMVRIKAEKKCREEAPVSRNCDESAEQDVFEKRRMRKFGGDWDLRFCCDSLHLSVANLLFDVTAEELRSLAFQYLDRHYEFQADCVRAAVGGWEYEEKAFAWDRFEEITDALCPEELADEFVEHIAEAEGEMVRLMAEEGDLLMHYTSRAGDYGGRS